jgi:ABC-2 type transport system ATP-binding protein
MDVLAKRQMIRFLKELNREQRTTIIVTSHDMDDLEEMAERILLISDGKLSFDGSFDQLRKTVGSMCHISLTMHNGGVPRLTCGNLISQSNDIYEFEVDTNKTSIKSVLSEISSLEGISDIELKKAPIEHVIADIYSKWRV